MSIEDHSEEVKKVSPNG